MHLDCGNLLHTLLKFLFPVLGRTNSWVWMAICCILFCKKHFQFLRRTNSWAYWLVLCRDLEKEAVEQITKGILSTLSLYYSTDCGCKQICVCIYLTIILSSTLQILLSPPEQSAFVHSFEC
jgi:hypothetical protein